MRRAKATMARFAPRRPATCATHVLSHVERPRCIITAAIARGLVTIANAILKTGVPWRQNPVT